MIAVSNSTTQTIAVGGSLTFDTVLTHSGCAECFRKGTGSIKMRANNGTYEVHFNANIGGTAEGDAELTMALSGDSLPETRMISVSTAAGDLNNVSATTLVHNCCTDFDRITVVNTGAQAVNVGENPVLFVKRIS